MLSCDAHNHLVPGRGAVETIAMARGLAEAGVRRLHLTPAAGRGSRRLADGVWRLLARAEIPIEVVAGAEYAYGEPLVDALVAGAPLIAPEHAGERCLLVGLPPGQPAVGVRRVGEAARRRGLRPVLSGPERYGAGTRAERWREAGWWFQLDLPALVGCYGPEAERRARDYGERGLYEMTGSDLRRPTDLSAVREARDAFLELAPETEVLS